MTNGFIFKTIFIIAILEVGVGGGGYAWPGKQLDLKQSVIHSFYQISEKITECWKYM